MEKVIVTGANGFVGTWLVKEMAKHGLKIFAVVRDENENIENIKDIDGVEIVYCDMSEMSSLRDKIAAEVDTFYHLAWRGAGGAERADYEIQLNNVRCACDAAVAAKALGCRKLLCAGTVTEKIAENILNIDVKAENTIYGLEKHNLHCLLDILCKKIGIDYVWMRFSNIYGPYNNSGNIVSYTLKELAKGNVPEFSKGLQPYDLVYIEDLVYGMYLLGENDVENNTYFIGSGTPRLLKDYLVEIRDIYGDNAQIALGARPEDGLEYKEEWFDTMPLERETGYRARFSFREGITKTVEWIKGI